MVFFFCLLQLHPQVLILMYILQEMLESLYLDSRSVPAVLYLHTASCMCGKRIKTSNLYEIKTSLKHSWDIKFSLTSACISVFAFYGL